MRVAGELQSRGLVHFSASKHGNHPFIVGRKHGPDPFALGLAVFLHFSPGPIIISCWAVLGGMLSSA